MGGIPRPCYDEATKTDCPRRHCGCAVDCKEWADYVEKREEMYHERKIVSDVDAIITASSMRFSAKRQKAIIADRRYRRRHGGR